MSAVMARKTAYTKITPLPSTIPRQLALDMLHSHTEMIKLNPLVTGVRPCDAPRDAAADEFFAQWYEISEIITWGFGMKKKIAFKGVFLDVPNGLQTHVYAPMGVDMRNKWSIRGNQPREPKEPRELGIEVPAEGLYLREDVEITCNIALTSFVKKEQKAAAGVMVDRLTRKAEMLDAGQLHAMFEDGQLKTVNPAIRRADNGIDLSYKSPGLDDMPGSPSTTTSSMFGSSGKYETYHDLVERRSSKSQRNSTYAPSYQQSNHDGENRTSQAFAGAQKPIAEEIVEMEGSYYHPQTSPDPNRLDPASASFSAELADTSVPTVESNTSPEAKHPAPLHPHSRNHSNVPSPQPSPALHQRHSSQGSPPPPGHPAQRTSYHRPYNPASPIHQSPPLEQREQNVQQYTVTNPDQSRPSHSRHTSSTTGVQTYQPTGLGEAQIPPPPLPQRNQTRSSAGLGISQATQPNAPDATQFGNDEGVTTCPVCGNFQGDEQAVQFHVSKHFS